VTEHGEGEALRLLAKAELRSTQVLRSELAVRQAVAGLTTWADRRCPVCDEVCTNCVQEADAQLRSEVNDLG
jgi:hypothetical protein